MNELHGVPLGAVTKGRSFHEVLEKSMRMWGDAKQIVADSEKNKDDVLSGIMAATLYRTYLLGVEDGMKEVTV